jgi:hypothetical protein
MRFLRRGDRLKLTLAAGVATVLLALAACGGSPGSSQGPASSPSVGASPSSAPSTGASKSTWA